MLGYVCGIFWYLGTCYWVYGHHAAVRRVPAPVAVLILILSAMHDGLYHGLFGLLVAVVAGRDGSQRRALAAAPFLWVAAEFALTRISAFPWELLGYAQTANFALTRIATLTGVYGLSWEIMLVNSVFAAAFLVARETAEMAVAGGERGGGNLAGRAMDCAPARCRGPHGAAGAAEYSDSGELDAGLF